MVPGDFLFCQGTDDYLLTFPLISGILSWLLLGRTGAGTGGTTGHVNLAALRTNGRVIGHRLRDNLPILPLGLVLFPNHMLLLMAPHGCRRLLRCHVGGRLEGDSRIVGAVLIFPLLAGLALAFLHDLLGRFRLFHFRIQFFFAEILDAAAYRHLNRVGAFPVIGDSCRTRQCNGAGLVPAYSRGGCHRGNRLICGARLCTGHNGGLSSCGSPSLNHSKPTQSGEIRRYFNCTGKSHKKICPGPQGSVYAEDLENMVYDCIAEKLADLKETGHRSRNVERGEINDLKLKIKAIEQQEKQLLDTMLTGGFNDALLAIANQKATQLKQDRLALYTQVEELNSRREETDVVVNLAKSWKTADYQRKKAVAMIVIHL